jgi:hypothetical protein
VPKTQAEKHAISESNLEGWRKLTPQQQLADLDRRLGKDKGATRQRAKLHAQIAAAAQPKTEPTQPKKQKRCAEALAAR